MRHTSVYRVPFVRSFFLFYDFFQTCPFVPGRKSSVGSLLLRQLTLWGNTRLLNPGNTHEGLFSPSGELLPATLLVAGVPVGAVVKERVHGSLLGALNHVWLVDGWFQQVHRVGDALLESTMELHPQVLPAVRRLARLNQLQGWTLTGVLSWRGGVLALEQLWELRQDERRVALRLSGSAIAGVHRHGWSGRKRAEGVGLGQGEVAPSEESRAALELKKNHDKMFWVFRSTGTASTHGDRRFEPCGVFL